MKWKISMMGTFRLSYKGITMNFNDLMGRQIASIFAFLILNRGHVVPKEQLIDVFWHDSRNPLNALKFAIFRLRKVFEEIPGHGQDKWILTGKGGYWLNPQLDCEVDIDELTALCEKADYRDAGKLADLITGHFLEDMDDPWILLQRDFYWQMLTRAAEKMTDSLEQEKCYASAELLYRQLLKLEPYSDQINYLKLRLLVRQQRYDDALHNYETLAASFYKDYGIEFAGKTQALCTFIRTENGGELTMDEIIQSLNEQTGGMEAFFCERPVFQMLYQAKMREYRRSGESFYLLLLNLKAEEKSCPETSMLEYFYRILKSTLRSSDIFCRISRSQYAVMMTLRQHEDADRVVDRIHSGFSKRYPENECRVEYEIQRIQPQPYS